MKTMKASLLTAAAAVLVVGLATVGCGGTSSASESSKDAPPRHPVARALAASLGGTKATCSREGWMVFVGERETVYGCSTGPDLSRSERCYVYIDGTVEDVTDRLADDDEPWPCTSELRAEAARKAKAERAAKARAMAADPYNKGFLACSNSKYRMTVTDELIRDANSGNVGPGPDPDARARAIAGTLADHFKVPAQNRYRWTNGCKRALW
jgi:hypothetical protein